MQLTGDYERDVELFDGVVKSSESFDVIKRETSFFGTSQTFFYIEGFASGQVLQKLFTHLASDGASFSAKSLPVAEASECSDLDELVFSLMSGKTVMFAREAKSAVIIDARNYPGRDATEPENDRVLRGSRDGFVETLLFNVALVRRRIRSADFRAEYKRVGRTTKCDAALCYMAGRVDGKLLQKLRAALDRLDTDSVTLGHESVAEKLIKKRWYDPFPKFRLTERPDVASASVLEGSVVLLVDNSPEATLFPTSLFDFLQEADDFYFPPFTGTYLRIIRHIVFLLSVILVPAWYLAVMNADVLPEWLRFAVPDDPGDIPIIVQLFLVEFSLDGLKLAYLNTPDTLSSSVSVVGGLLLGDFAVKVGWLSPDVILYMAFASVANYTQSSYDLGYAFKYLRMTTLALTALFGAWGFFAGIAVGIILAAVNKTFSGRSYLWPLIPFDRKAAKRLFTRPKKFD
ncbi:MAG: spore germination protein [Clostridia bacterium]|nr:spore germination protein [Clostridia bacterium]